MELIPVRPMWRSFAVGMGGGLVLVLGVVVWRALAEDTAGGTAIGFAASAAVCAAIGIALIRWRLPKTARKAERAPDDAELCSRKPINWRWVLPGVAIAAAAIGRSADDDAVFAGVLTGMVAGGAVAFTLAVRWIATWETETRQELFMHRPGGFKKGGYYVRELGSQRFERGAREREAAPSR